MLFKIVLGLLISQLALAEAPSGRVFYYSNSSHPSSVIPSLNPQSAALNSALNGEASQAAQSVSRGYDRALNDLSVQLRDDHDRIKTENQRLVEEAKKFNPPSMSYSLSSDKAIEEARTKLPVRPGLICLDLIPDPSSLPYHFRSNHSEVIRTYTDLYKTNPQFGKQKAAREIGLFASQEADQSYASGDNESGGIYHEIAVDMLDLVVGIDPVTGTGRSAYELIMGKNFITGKPLGSLERTLSFVGLITMGQSKNIQKVGQGVLKIASHIPNSALQPIVQGGERLATKVGSVLHGFMKSHRITQIEKAAEANARLGYSSPPYQPGSRVVHFVTTKDTQWIRIHHARNQKGHWIVKSGEVKGLSPQQISDKLNLPSLPTHYTEISLPKGITMSRGMTSLNHWDNGLTYTIGGQVQYRIERDTLDAAWYGIAKTIPVGGF